MKAKWCPVCGSDRTSFSESYSDGEERVEKPIEQQECVNRKCGLCCKFWDGIKDMLDELMQDDSVQLMDSKWIWTGNGQRVFAD